MTDRRPLVLVNGRPSLVPDSDPVKTVAGIRYGDNTLQTTQGALSSLSNLIVTAVNASLLPAINDGYDIGSEALRWQDGYFTALHTTNGVRFNDGSIQTTASSGTFGGSIAANQVAFGSSSNTLQGSANLTYDGSSLTLASLLTFNGASANLVFNNDSAHTVTTTQSTTTVGRALSISSGSAPTTATAGGQSGGTLTLSAGTGANGAPAIGSGTGGAIAINLGAGGSGSTALVGGNSAGNLTIAGGIGGTAGSGSGTGGSGSTFTITAGAGGAASTGTGSGGNGGTISLQAGKGGAVSTTGAAGANGGNITISPGTGLGVDGYGTHLGSAAGFLTISMGFGGNGGTTAAGRNAGGISITAGNGGTAGTTSGNGGIGSTFTWLGGNGGAASTGSGSGGLGGGFSATAGTGGAASSTGTAGAGSTFSLTAGAAGDSATFTGAATGGNFSITAGHGSNATSGTAGVGGDMSIAAGAAGTISGGTGASGGNISMSAGLASGAGTNGTITIGASNTSAIAIGMSGITTTVTGGLSQLTGALNLTANAASQITTSSGALTFTAAANSTWTAGATAGTIVGGTATSASLTLESTSGAGATDSIIFKTASQVTRATFNTAGNLTLTPAAGTATNLDLQTLNTQATTGIARIAFPSAVTQGANTIIGLLTDLSTNLTTPAAGQSVTAIQAKTPSVSTTSNAIQYIGYDLANTGTVTNATAGSITWRGVSLTMPNITQSAGGTVTASGVTVLTGTITTGGTIHGINISASGVGAGTLNGINISNITGGAGTETAVLIGTGWDNAVSIASAAFVISGTGVVTAAAGVTSSGTITFSGVSASTGSIVLASSTGVLSSLTDVATGQVLTSGGVGVAPAYSATPTLTSLTAPTIIGGTATSSTLTLESTSGAGATDQIIFKTGSQVTRAAFNTAGNLTLTPATGTATNLDVQSLNTQATTGITRISFPSAVTQGAGTIIGERVDLNTNLTTPTAGQSLTVFEAKTPTVSTTSNAITYTGYDLPTAGTVTNATAGSIAWRGTSLTMPNITQSAGGSVTASGALITTGTITTAGTVHGLNIAAQGIGAGTLNGINISNIAAGAGTENAIQIGTGWDTHIKGVGALTITAAAASTWSTSSGVLTVDSAAALNLGNTNATSLAVGHSGITTTVTGGLTQLTGAFSLTGNAVSQLSTTSGALTVDSAAALNLGTSTATSVVLAKAGVTTSITDALNVGASKFQVDSSGNLIKLNNVVQSWPSTQGAASTFLQNNGAGVLSWASVSSTGANTALSNLTPTTINVSLVPAINDGYNFGSDANRWHDGYFSTGLHLGTSLADEGLISYNTTSNVLSINSTGTVSVSAPLILGSGISLPIVTKTSNYTATAADYTILCDANLGTFTVSLPTAVGIAGRTYIIKKIDSSANIATIDANASETIDGMLTQDLTAVYESITMQSDGIAWYIV